MNKLQLCIKNLIDRCTALLLLLLLWPILLFFSVLILLFDGRPILFVQRRPGLNEKIFTLFKFRTMRLEPVEKNENDKQRLTRLGSFLRKYSIDELPQLLNVLKGDLSLVGPRPLLVEYIQLYSRHQRKRHLVKPGITGWAQVNGRNAISWEKKFEYDLWYVENWSLWLDIKILWMTFFKIFNTSEVNSSSEITMEKFKGSQ